MERVSMRGGRMYSAWLRGNMVIYPAGAGPGKEVFVDADSGSDTNDGLSWERSKLTIAAGHGVATDGADDYLYLRGNFGDEALTITKSKLHIFGMRDGLSKSYLTRVQSGGSATGATFLIQARDVEIGHLQVIGNRDDGKHYPAIFADGDTNGTRSYLHDLFLPMLTPSGTAYCNGIDLRGDRHVVESCIIESQAIGIRVFSTAQATYEIHLEDIRMYACNVGVDVVSLQQGTGQHGLMGKDMLIDGYGAYAVDVGIKVRTGNPIFENCHVAAYGTNQAGNYTVGNGKFVRCTWTQTTGASTANT